MPAWCSRSLHQAGILTANHPDRDPGQTNRSDEGAIQMCEESHYEAALLDELDDLGVYSLLILPDATVITPRLLPKLRKYYRAGGKLIISHHGGRDVAGRWALDFLPLSFAGEEALFPTYWRTRKKFWPEFSTSDRVVYSQGTKVVPRRNLEILVDRVLPYFKRTELTFSSHFQTPPVARAGRFPAVVAGRNFAYLADPVFREYRETGNGALRDVWRRLMARLIGTAPFGHDLPTTMLCLPRRRRRDLLLTLLHYIPLRKALEGDVLEERMGFAGESLRLPPAAAHVRVFGENSWLPRNADGSHVLPQTKGRLLLEVPGFFRSSAS